MSTPDQSPPLGAAPIPPSASTPVGDVVIAHKQAVDEMQARGVRVALIQYADALRAALENGGDVRTLVEIGIPIYDIRKAAEARGRAAKLENHYGYCTLPPDHDGPCGPVAGGAS